MPDLSEQFEAIVRLSGEGRVHDGLASRTREVLEHGADDEVRDIVFEEISKYVEVQLRGICEAFSGSKLVGEARSGRGLVKALGSAGLITQSNGNHEPIHFLLLWYFGDQRNPAHHDYFSHSFETFTTFFWASNFILTNFEERKREMPLPIAMSISLVPNDAPIGTFVNISASIQRPIKGTIFQIGDGNVTAFLTYHNGFMAKAGMTFAAREGRWKADVATSGGTAGDYNVEILAIGPDEKFVSRNRQKGRLV